MTLSHTLSEIVCWVGNFIKYFAINSSEKAAKICGVINNN